MLSNPKVRAILVNIFGGIMKCDTIATGVVAAAREVKLSVPLVVRMKGTNEDLGKQILKDSGLPIISADNMAQAGQRIVAAIKARAAKKATPRPKPKARAQRKARAKPKAKARRAAKPARKAGAKASGRKAAKGKKK
jgi:hypothetical protein